MKIGIISAKFKFRKISILNLIMQKEVQTLDINYKRGL